MGTTKSVYKEDETALTSFDKVKLYDVDAKTFEQFLSSYESSPSLLKAKQEAGPWEGKSYMNQLQKIYEKNSRILKISLTDVDAFAKKNSCNSILRGLLYNYPRYIQLMYRAVDSVMRNMKELFEEARCNFAVEKDIGSDIASLLTLIDDSEILREEYMRNGHVPAALRANYEILIIPPTEGKDSILPVLPIREIDATKIGKLARFTCDVVRVSPAKPRITVAAYECDRCHNHLFQGIESFGYMPIFDCPGCLTHYTIKHTLKSNLRLSKFMDFEKVKVTESTEDVPQGDVPVAITCHALGNLSKELKLGMRVTLTGVLSPSEQGSFSKYHRGLTMNKYFTITHIEHTPQYKATINKTQVLQSELDKIYADGNVYERLSASLAPEIYGYSDIKKALLLQLVGGNRCVKSDGGIVRGDIHMLLMGDPGVAKSQFMKRVCQIAKRSIYTTGKGSSTAGLTAAIVKDPVTNETSLEGGALVLADKGTCCIDEFDKMDEYDRCAIYEIMEQQQVSVAKAGHCCTMAARACVLAAANPAHGRYNPRKSFMANMNLPAALLTRFDLQFLILDKVQQENDMQLAQHILSIFDKKISEQDFNYDGGISLSAIAAYISECKLIEPSLPISIRQRLVDWYIDTRLQEQEDDDSGAQKLQYTTSRALLAILRLAQAHAKLRKSEIIEDCDIEEALRLGIASKESLGTAQNMAYSKKIDPISCTIDTIRREKARLASMKNWDGWIQIGNIETQLIQLGLKKRQIIHSIDQYVALGVLIHDQEKMQIAFPQDITDVQD